MVVRPPSLEKTVVISVSKLFAPIPYIIYTPTRARAFAFVRFLFNLKGINKRKIKMKKIKKI